jgi:hypothetical protein
MHEFPAGVVPRLIVMGIPDPHLEQIKIKEALAV